MEPEKTVIHEEPGKTVKAYRVREVIDRYLGMSGIAIHYKPMETYDVPELYQRLFDAAREISEKRELIRQ